jgi:hypothetical protein
LILKIRIIKNNVKKAKVNRYANVIDTEVTDKHNFEKIKLKPNNTLLIIPANIPFVLLFIKTSL